MSAPCRSNRKMLYCRYGRCHGGFMRITQAMTIDERLAHRIKIDEATGCHIWLGHLNSKGYGQAMIAGKLKLVHRILYERVNGPIPGGLQIDHLCKEKRCCNPDHLEAVTCHENLMRGTTRAAIHAAKTCCPKCGGPYTPKPEGGRRCHPCHLELMRSRYHRNKLVK